MFFYKKYPINVTTHVDKVLKKIQVHAQDKHPKARGKPPDSDKQG